MIIKKNLIISFLIFSFFVSFLYPLQSRAQTGDVNASKLLAHTELSLSPRNGSFVEGSTFDVPILVNTKGRSINGVEIVVSYDKDKLSIVRPSGGTSIIGLWVEPPAYDNTKGTARYVGVIPGGITTGSGLIGNITFQAKSSGRAVVSFRSNSKVLLNDGLGTEAIVDLGRAEYTILPTAPGGVNVFSDTHPFQSTWYNNDSPVISWDKDVDVEGFSYVMDNKPGTIPENNINTTATSMSFPELSDGLWYFHIKAIKKGVWGSAGHFLVRVDTAPPASFTPDVNYLMAGSILVDRTLVSFFTTDNLSGVSHYEVGIIDKSQPTTVSPSFVRAESPFQVPVKEDSNLEVIVRAIDFAGNIRDESINVVPPVFIVKFLKDNMMWILLGLLLALILGMIIHYYAGHHIHRGLKKVGKVMNEPIPPMPIPGIPYTSRPVVLVQTPPPVPAPPKVVNIPPAPIPQTTQIEIRPTELK
jgi:hypothetical protein